MELQPDLSSDRGLGEEKNARLSASVAEFLQRSKVDIVSLDGGPIKSVEPCSVDQTPGRTPVSVMTSGTNAKHPIRIQK